MMSSRCLLLCFWVAALIGGSATAKSVDEEHAQAIIDWIKSKDGGVVHEKLEVRADNSVHLGVYVTGDVLKGQVLMSIPNEILITAGDDTRQDYAGIWCPTAFNLIREMKLGDESKYAPYVNYLSDQPHGQLPSAWSKAGQELLKVVIGQNDDDDENDLPPLDVTGWIGSDWYQNCNGTDDPFDRNAALLLVQRGWGDHLIPLFDMMNHRNGKWDNTEFDPVHQSDQLIVVRASRDISAGEQVYTSYNLCPDCGAREMGYGTSEILRDYGFVEQYPQRWFFSWRLSFELDQADDSGDVQLRWLTESLVPERGEVEALLEHVERLGELEEVVLAADSDTSIPKHELSVITAYHQAITNAMTLALRALGVSVDDFHCNMSGGGSCDVSLRYDDLSWRPDEVRNYITYTCDTDESMDFEDFETVESTRSHYQEITYVKDPKNDNVCFDISDIIQMCGSYRPFYHEMVVHYSGRFLGTIKRVMFVGGGDSMLLHDILKYPSLELVVGLELDQVITRLSYKHYGTQPHFDNAKVEWWFGDAAKSLLMLPKDYFGSFDLVLVDLSETVMSLSVTDGLDIFQALSLLLKPEGILVKNELYLDKLSSIFDYSIHIHIPHMPVMCSQHLIFGSNKNDFLWNELTDHDLETLYIQPIPKIEDRYELFHDYRHNSTSEHLCKEEGSPEVEPKEQTRSPGILMILEAEDVSTQLIDAEKLAHVLVEAIQTAGLKVMSSETSSTETGLVVALFLREGYVITRTWSEHNYCAIDIHLWSSFDKHEGAKTALVDAIGSKSPSAYRIVAGGMFGVSTWKEDDMKRGPRVVDTCVQGDKEQGRDKQVKLEIANTILSESLKLIPDTDVKIVVVCGAKKEGCSSLTLLEKVEGIQVVPLISCMSNANEFEESVSENMKACEKETNTALLDAVSDGKQIRAIIIDPSAPLLFTRVTYKVFKTRRNKLFNRELLAGIAMIFDETESWRRNLLERLHEIIDHDPCFRAEVLLNSTDSTVELDVLSSGDDSFVSRLVAVVSNIEDSTGLVSEVRGIKGGPSVKDPDWEPSHFFAPEDFDQHGALRQWESQQPLGFQTVFQLEADVSLPDLDMSPEGLSAALHEILHEMESGAGTKGMEHAKFHKAAGAGLGCVVAALWPGGNCVVLWDGFGHVDLNLFLIAEDFELADEFSTRFNSKFGNKFNTALKDTQPRGIGRVVNFRRDIEPRLKPHWARFKV